MNPIKKIIIEETVKVLRELKNRKKISEIESNLYEAIKTAEMVKSNPNKNKVANKIVKISEAKFIQERNRIKENHQYEDESEMARAQLLSIIDSANELYRMMDGVSQLEDWLQYKLSIAENYLDAVHGYMKYFNGGEEMDHEEMENNDQWDDVEEEDFNDMDDETFDDFEDFDDDDDDLEYDEEDFDEEDEESEFI